MDITFFVESFAGLVSLLGVLIFFLLYSPNRKKKLQVKKQEDNKREEERFKVGLNALVDIIRDKKSTGQELKDALESIINLYGNIDKFDVYGEVLIRICRHPNTSKSIILNFNTELENKNPKDAKKINDFITKGLHSR